MRLILQQNTLYLFRYAIPLLQIETSFPRWKLTYSPPKECHNSLNACARCLTRHPTPLSIGAQRLWILTVLTLAVVAPTTPMLQWNPTRHRKPMNPVPKTRICEPNHRVPQPMEQSWMGLPARWSWRQHLQSYTKHTRFRIRN